jgi:hypothetical protein
MILRIAKTFLRDYFNMPYFEGGYLNIYLFNNMLQRLKNFFKKNLRTFQNKQSLKQVTLALVNMFGPIYIKV